MSRLPAYLNKRSFAAEFDTAKRTIDVIVTRRVLLGSLSFPATVIASVELHTAGLDEFNSHPDVISQLFCSEISPGTDLKDVALHDELRAPQRSAA